MPYHPSGVTSTESTGVVVGKGDPKQARWLDEEVRNRTGFRHYVGLIAPNESSCVLNVLDVK